MLLNHTLEICIFIPVGVCEKLLRVQQNHVHLGLQKPQKGTASYLKCDLCMMLYLAALLVESAYPDCRVRSWMATFLLNFNGQDCISPRWAKCWGLCRYGSFWVG